jgi:hypothetical protein
MDIVPTLVAYHSIYWIRVAVESYLEHFPADRLLIVNNNPRRGEAGWYPYCDEELEWLATHPRVFLVDNPRLPGNSFPGGRLEHGSGIDVALDWCREHGARVLVHMEPDCLISGRQWRENLLRPLAQGAWMAGSFRQSHGAIHPTPSAWLVVEVRASFRSGSWAREKCDPGFAALVNLAALEDDPSPEACWMRQVGYWDTGHRAWFQAASQGRATLVETPGFRHYWRGSVARRFSENTLAGIFPELRPFLERARLRRLSLPVEACLFREAVRTEADTEVACCRLLRQLSGVAAPSLCVVRRDACTTCCASGRPSLERINPVVASLLYGLTQQVIEQGGVPGCTAAAADDLRRRAEAEIDLALP